jgi:hypothetical protein
MPKQRLRPVTAQASDVTPDVVDVVDGSDADETETPTETPAAPQARGLGDYMQAFGDAEGARMFLAGKAWEQAQQDTISALRGQLQDANAELSQLKSRAAELMKAQAGEDTAVQVPSEGKKKSFGEACRAAKK